MKFRSLFAAVVPCVLLTTLLVRAQDKPKPPTYLLKLQLSKTLTQEITITDNDEFHISTADKISKWVVEGKTEIIQEPGQQKVMVINLLCRNQPADAKENPSVNRLMTRVAVPLESKIVLMGGLSTDNPRSQGGFSVKAPAKFKEAESTFRVSVEKAAHQNKDWSKFDEGGTPFTNPYR